MTTTLAAIRAWRESVMADFEELNKDTLAQVGGGWGQVEPDIRAQETT